MYSCRKLKWFGSSAFCHHTSPLSEYSLCHLIMSMDGKHFPLKLAFHSWKIQAGIRPEDCKPEDSNKATCCWIRKLWNPAQKQSVFWRRLCSSVLTVCLVLRRSARIIWLSPAWERYCSCVIHSLVDLFIKLMFNRTSNWARGTGKSPEILSLSCGWIIVN